MKDLLARPLLFATLVAAVASASAMIASKAYAESPTVDQIPFISKRSAAEVRAETRAARVTLDPSEWDLQRNGVRSVASSYTRPEAKSSYLDAREESHALVAEDSGAAYLIKHSLDQRRTTMGAAMR